jgi:ParG
MTEPAEPPAENPPATAFSSMDAAGLLVHALGQLPPAERDKVYTWLLGTSLQLQRELVAPLGGQLTRAIRVAAQPSLQQDFAEAEAEVLRSLSRGQGAAAQQMVPVRFSAQQHARLRAWCTEHGFSMATVIRGLVDRFLDGQQAPQSS